jgi:uncharacterized protein with NRDE domain
MLFFALKQHPTYPVIICANRDEFHQRPTKEMHWWPDKENQESILAGKDMEAGGTWLGLNKQGRFSALTNFREPQLFDKNKKSRGDIVIQALAKQDEEINEQLVNSAHRYNGFNLVFGKLNNLAYFNSTSKKQQALTPGFHSLCNGDLDDIWPKMALGQKQLANAILDSSSQELNSNDLFTLMQNNQQAEIKKLPNTGIPLDWEQRLSSIFIISPEYGTRTTNIITQDNNGNISVYDRSYNSQGICIKAQQYSISLS